MLTLYFPYTRNAAQPIHQPHQVANVAGIDHKLNDSLSARPRLCIDSADIRSVVGDNGCHFAQHSGAIVAENSQLYRIRSGGQSSLFRLHTRPLDSDAAVGFIEQLLHIRTAPRMDADDLPRVT